MLYVVGLGLGNEKDVTVKGLEAIRSCDKVYMEAYTSLLSFGLSPDGISSLEKLYEKQIIVSDREMVEEKADIFLEEARSSDVAFLVVGDPFGATTHGDLIVRARNLGINVRVVHNASVMNAVGVCGLQLYRYGETISIPFFTKTWRPDSFYEKIKQNRSLGLHTLCLLDIRVKEPSLESLCRGRKVYEPPRFMTVNTAIEQLLEVEKIRGEGGGGSSSRSTANPGLSSEEKHGVGKQMTSSMIQVMCVAPAALGSWEARFEDIFQDDPFDMLDAALSDTVTRFPIDIQPFKDMMEGMRMDLTKSRYRDLRRAISVLLLCCWDSGSDDRSSDCLLTFSGTARKGKLYLLQDELVQARIPDDDVFSGRVTNKWRDFTKSQIKRA
ncbi:hypothetical protein MLD38_033756 [Melastoma candidum]|uniref:Uncharacterized protein n=1 Tax=Melastoma candidum TaxID=119954 RepID=A0ACB9M7S2_9MYRT|nr:hypothetical protein MLD38_033756 [Melastoma candidum]